MNNVLGDNLWYRAMCVKTANSCNENYCEVYFIDWGVQYSVSIGNIHKISKEFIYLPASAFKCYIQGNFHKLTSF